MGDTSPKEQSAMAHTTKLGKQGKTLSVAIPEEVLEAAGLSEGDVVELVATGPGRVEIRSGNGAAERLDEAFEWALARYGKTFTDLSK
jgi:bifunctional DNA-binding transcriptional regulator/antitoxin component of YhaV-PrlF toxin-antitoxin module